MEPYEVTPKHSHSGEKVKVSASMGMKIGKSNQASHLSRLVVATRNRPLINPIVVLDDRVSGVHFHVGHQRHSSGLSWSQRFLKEF